MRRSSQELTKKKHFACTLLCPQLRQSFVTYIMMKLLLAVQVVGLFLLLLGKASAQADQSVRDKLASSIDEYGLTAADVASIATTNVGITSSGVEVVHLQQILRGIPVKNGRLLGTVGAETKIKKNTFQKNLNTCANARNPTLSAEEAVRRAGEVAGVASPEELQVLFKENGPEKTTTFQGSNALSIDETIPSHLTYYIADEDCDVRLSWQVLIHPNADEWLDMVIDAVSGESIFIDNWVSGASFLSAFEAPKEAPCKTCTEWGTPEFNPYNVDLMTLATVPDAWLDGTGITRGNNVYAVADIAANNVGVATTATSGTNIFDYRVDLSLSNPSQWKNAAVVNLFYWNNIIHDVLYEYGFDEVNGNFQEDNNGKGGASGDSVKAEAQDGSGTNNANMSTPPDGSNPRMQMFMWNGNLDSSFDSGGGSVCVVVVLSKMTAFLPSL
jgi:extracellular elastinolytic metalloproteinase